MRLSFVLLLLLLLFLSASASDYLIRESNTRLLSEAELEGKSIEFLRYARNEIFARHRYKFADDDLLQFFKQRSWYRDHLPLDKIKLSDIERTNVELLKQLEEEKRDFKIITSYKKEFNNGVVFYIYTEKNMVHPRKPDYTYTLNTDYHLLYFTGDYLWILDCESIPPEFIIENAQKSFNISDDGSALQERNFRIVDFDEGLENNRWKELRIGMSGPSDDPSVHIFGFNNEDEFVKLFEVGSGRVETAKVSDNIMSIKTRIRDNWLGTHFHEMEFLYNNLTNIVYPVPELTISQYPPWTLECLKEIPIYYDARSAALYNEHAIIDTMLVGQKFLVTEFYRSEGYGSVKITVSIDDRDIIAWLPQKEVNAFGNFKGLCAAD